MLSNKLLVQIFSGATIMSLGGYGLFLRVNKDHYLSSQKDLFPWGDFHQGNRLVSEKIVEREYILFDKEGREFYWLFKKEDPKLLDFSPRTEWAKNISEKREKWNEEKLIVRIQKDSINSLLKDVNPRISLYMNGLNLNESTEEKIKMEELRKKCKVDENTNQNWYELTCPLPLNEKNLTQNTERK